MVNKYADVTRDKLFAYTLDGGARQAGKEFALHSDNANPTAIWSDGDTIWVADNGDDKLYAYALDGGARRADKEFDLHRDNADPTKNNGNPDGIWSDGVTIWVVDGPQGKLYAYALDGGARQAGKEFDLGRDNQSARGLWSDGAAIWVADSSTDQLYAYALADGTPLGRMENPLHSENGLPWSIWSNGDTIWVADRSDSKLYAYPLPDAAAPPAHLTGLTISPGTLTPAFGISTREYTVPDVPSDVSRITITATAETGATVAYEDGSGYLSYGESAALVDADSNTAGFQADLAAGENPIAIKVTEGDASETYTVTVTRATAPATDIRYVLVTENGVVLNDSPKGIWSDGDTIWVANGYRSTKLYAHALDGGEHRADKDITPHSDNGSPTYIWSDGDTIWVVDGRDDKLYAYALAGGERRADKDIALHSDNGHPGGIWSDGDTIWVTGRGHRLYAYALAGGERRANKDIALDSRQSHYSGIWSDGDNTIWVVDGRDCRLYAYTWPTGTRLRGAEVVLHRDQCTSTTSPGGVWSDGDTIWVVNRDNSWGIGGDTEKLYGYALPAVSAGRPNQAPTASVTATPTVVRGGGTVTLHGTASDPENDPLTYAWTSSTLEGPFGNAAALDTTWKAGTAAANDRDVRLTLTVTDSAGAFATASVHVTVRANQAPEVSVARESATVVGGSAVELDGTTTDPEDDTLTFAWTSSGGGTFADASALDTSWTAPAATTSAQSITLTLTVTDRGAGQRTSTATVSVTVPARANTAPTASATTSTSTVLGGGAVSLDGTASDPQNDPLTYAWTSNGGGTFANAAALDTTWTAPAAGLNDRDVTLTLTVTDTAGAAATATVQMTVRANQAPEVSVARESATVVGGSAVELDGTTTDPEDDTLTFAWSSTGGGTFANASALDTTWTAPAATTSAQSIILTLTVTDDGAGQRTSTATVSVTVPARGNTAPTASATTSTSTVLGGGVVSLDGTASDPQGDRLTYAWTSNGGGTFANAAALDTTWTAPAAGLNDRDVTLTLTVTDTANASATATVSVTVRENQAPTASATADRATVNGRGTVALTGTATDPEGDALTYAWSSNGGGTFDDDSALDTTWTAPAKTNTAQSITLTLTVTDDGAGMRTSTATVSVTVPARGNTAPTASATATPTVVLGGGAVSLDGTASDPQGDRLTYAWTSNGGGTFANAAALDTTWTAPAATNASQRITLTLTVTDTANAFATATVSVTVRENQAPTASATADAATVNGRGTVALNGTATDPEGDALTYAWSSTGGGTFDDGSALDTTWTAPAKTNTAQSITLTLTVTDDGAGMRTSTATVSVTVRANRAPDVSVDPVSTTVDGGAGVTLDGTASDPDGDSLSYAWSSSGGGSFANAAALDTTWTAPAATNASQPITLTLTVTDATMASDVATLQVTVRANQAPDVSVAPESATVVGGSELVLDGTATDPEGDGLTYAWSSNGGGSFDDGSAVDTTWMAPAATTSAQSIILTLTVTDDGAGQRTSTATVSVTVPERDNTAPTASAVTSTSTVLGGGAVSLDGTASDPQGDRLTYAWTSNGGGTFANAAALDTTWTAPAAGLNDRDVTLTLTVTDTASTSATTTVSVTVRENQAPTASATADAATVNGGGTVALTGTATDPEGDTLTYAWSSNGGGTFDDGSVLDTTWTAPPKTDEVQTITLTLTVTDDGAGARMASATVEVTVPGNEPPPPPTVDICDRTPEVEAAILLQVRVRNPDATCSTTTAAELAAVPGIVVSGYSSSSLLPSDLDGLTGLTSLSLSHSPLLTAVPADAFRGFTRAGVTHLFFSRNGIETVHEDAFHGFSGLQQLYLGDNNIRTLEEDVFDGLTALTELNLSGNTIIRLEAEIFDGLTSLETLHLSYNDITSLHQDLFDGLTALKTLQVGHTEITTLQAGVFEDLTALTILGLVGNRIATLPEDAFRGLTSLEELFLHSNRLTTLPADLFDPLGDSLTNLRLDDNSFATLDADIFDGLTGLTVLGLTGNSTLTTLPAGVFDGLVNLQELLIFDSGLTSLPAGLFDPLDDSLKELHLYGNSLTTLDADIFDGLTGLERLTLNDNSLATLPEDVFDGLVNLKELWLQRNSLTTLETDLFDPLDDSLTYLPLSDNGLTSLHEDIFDGLTGLKTLILGNNDLTTLHEDIFDPLDSLTGLSLHDNGLTSLHEDIFEGLDGLSWLFLSNNNLTTLEADLFDPLGAGFSSLYLTDNDITALPADIFDGLTGLVQLDLSCNALTALDLTRFDPFATSLTFLDISGNTFTTDPTEAALRAKLTNAGLRFFTGANTACLLPGETGLSALTLSSGTLDPAFTEPGATSYQAEVDYAVTEVTVTFTLKDPDATFETLGDTMDVDPHTHSIRVPLMKSGRNFVNWKVRAKDGYSTRDYHVTIFRAYPPTTAATPTTGGGGGGGGGGGDGPSPSDRDFEWTVKHDLAALDGGNAAPTGAWADGTTLWVADNPDGAGDGVYAYALQTGDRLKEREFPLDEKNRAPRGIWADGTTIWVSDSGQDKLFAYDLATGERLEDRDIALDARNGDPRGLWADATLIWVLDDRATRVFVYALASGALLAAYPLAARNSDPQGIWSDRVTVWISDAGASPRRLFAYRLPVPADEQGAEDEADELERVREEDFTHLSSASNNSPRGIWSDGDVMYVVDASDDRVYTYNMPDAGDARLAALTLSGIAIGAFDPSQTGYEGVIAEGVAETTVTAAALQRRTAIAIAPPDADGDETNGHQITLAGLAAITVTVTAADGQRTKTYRVRLGDGAVAAAPPGLTLDLRAGGDLVPVPVGAATTAADLFDGTDVTIAWQYNRATRAWDRSYLPALGRGGFPIAGGDVLWVVASVAQTLPVAGTPPPTAPVADPITLDLRAGGDLVVVPPGAATRAADLFDGTDVTVVWQYTRATRAWDRAYLPALGRGGFAIAPGDVLWVVAPRAQTVGG